MDHDTYQGLIRRLHSKVAELGTMFPGWHFLDQHMIGGIGERVVADAYGLEFITACNKGFDALTSVGIKLEIKATQSTSVAFRSEPEQAILFKIPCKWHR